MSSELDQIKQIFNNFGILLSMEWLESCIEWCKSDNLPPNYTLKNLQNMVYEQWLILDLRDVEISSLPRDLGNERKYSLSGVYYLQVMQVIDISKPKLWQLQRIRKNVAKNTELENDFGKRVLQLTLTDGVQEVQAMEFKPITCLNINLTPGTKLKITGPVMVRNGRLMLEQENVKNLGGSVDDLLISNAAENVLARALGLEENPNPQIIDEKVLEVSTQANITAQANTTARNQNYSGSNQNTVKPDQIRQINQNQIIPPEFEVDDELLRELEADFEENSASNFKNTLAQPQNTRISNKTLNTDSASMKSTKVTSNRHCSSPDLFEEMEFDDDLLNEHLDELDRKVSSISKAFNSNTTEKVDNKNVKDSIKSKPEGKVISLDDSFDDIDIDSHLDNIDEEIANRPCSTQKIKDFKKNIKSPELKVQKLGVAKLRDSKKLTLGNKSLALRGSLDLGESDEDDFEKPFSIFAKSGRKPPPSLVPLKLPCEAKEPRNLAVTCIPSSSKQSSLQHASVASQEGTPPLHSTNSPKPSKINVLTIEKLKNLLPNVSKGKFKIRGKFVVVSEKLRTLEREFYLVLTVSDTTGQLDVKVQSDIVANFAKVTPQRLAELRELVFDRDETAGSVILERASQFGRKKPFGESSPYQPSVRLEKNPENIKELPNSMRRERKI